MENEPLTCSEHAFHKQGGISCRSECSDIILVIVSNPSLPFKVIKVYQMLYVQVFLQVNVALYPK